MRIALLILAAAFALAAAPIAHGQEGPREAPQVRARSAIVVETSTGDIAFAKKPDTRRAIASTTKLMTALVTLEEADLDDLLRAPAYEASPVESQIGLREGERMNVRDLLRALLLPSANDAAATLAEGVAGSRREFVELMNRRAERLGLQDTRFANPIGLDDPDNFSSAGDLARLAVRLRRNEFFRRTVDLPRVTLRSGARDRVVLNRNTLVREHGFVDGVKTGRTQEAGYVLVGSATRDGVTVISVVLGAPTESTRDEDSLQLLRYGLSRYRATRPVSEGQVLARPALRYRDGERVALVAAEGVQHVARRGERPRVTVSDVPEEVDGPLPRGSRVGTAVVRDGEQVVARVPLVTAAPVAEAGLVTRLEDLLRTPITVVALVLLVACSLPLLALRRRAMRRRRAVDRHRERRLRRKEETPVA